MEWIIRRPYGAQYHGDTEGFPYGRQYRRDIEGFLRNRQAIFGSNWVQHHFVAR